MGKQRKGSIVERAGKLYVRINYTDQLGKRRELMRRAQNRQHARELKIQLVKQLGLAEDQRAELDPLPIRGRLSVQPSSCWAKPDSFTGAIIKRR